MLSQLAQTYARAIYELAVQRKMLDAVQAQLELVTATVAAHPDLRGFLEHPLVPPQAKKDTMTKIFAGELTDFVSNFLLLLIDKGRETVLPAIVRQYVDIANKARNITVAEVITVKPLTPEQSQALADKLSQVTGSRILLKPAIDEQILGGVIVKLGGKLIDASLVRQLQSLKTVLAAREQTAV